MLLVLEAPVAFHIRLNATASMVRLSGRIRVHGTRLASFSLGVYGWFTEWFDTRDLKEAKGLLDELAT
jgi:hypothetical protein